MTPRLPPRGFLESRQEQPLFSCSTYRRFIGRVFPSTRYKILLSSQQPPPQAPRSLNLVNSLTLLSKFLIKNDVLAPHLLPSVAVRLRSTRRGYPQSGRHRRLFLYTHGPFSDSGGMAILVLSDLHSNALTRTVLDAAQDRWDFSVCLGDVVGYGPIPTKSRRAAGARHRRHCVEITTKQPPD